MSWLQRYDAYKQTYVKTELPRNNNAYLVIYDRVQPPDEPQKSPMHVPAAPVLDEAGVAPMPPLALTETGPTAAEAPSGEAESKSGSEAAGAGESKGEEHPSAPLVPTVFAKPPLFRDFSYSSMAEGDVDSDMGSPLMRFGKGTLLSFFLLLLTPCHPSVLLSSPLSSCPSPHTRTAPRPDLPCERVAAATAVVVKAPPVSTRGKRGAGWLPPRILRAVWSENSGFLLDRSVFSPVMWRVPSFLSASCHVCVCVCTRTGVLQVRVVRCEHACSRLSQH